ncbi:MAG: MFS transporter [Pseudonocardia sp.]
MSTAEANGADGAYQSLVPARMDRLPWSRFHTRVVVALGVSWILDGLEIQIVSQVGTVLADRGSLGLTSTQAPLLASAYLFGEVLGALVFGRITDRLGRRRLFFVTLTLYLVASGMASLSFDVWFLLLCRFLAGAGIGGEYCAINSAIDELIPPYFRGRVDISVNGTYWAGAILGAGANVLLLDPHLLPIDVGWRVGFLIGPVIGMGIIFLRRGIPESPRWLMTHGRLDEAERIVDTIEADTWARGIDVESVTEDKELEFTGRADVSYRAIARSMLRDYPSRSVLGFTMMATQAILYNAVFFNYSLVLVLFFHVPDSRTSWYFLPFAAGNLIGPLVLARLFDTVGRRKMITCTYCVSGVLLAVGSQLFAAGLLTAATHTAMLCLIFFFASAGASSAYLTISEIFPLELRAQAISFFFALSLLVGGVATPPLFAGLAASGVDREPLSHGYLALGAIMFAGGVVAWLLGVDAERKSLEEIANPLSAVRRIIEPSAQYPP